eukprot:g41525.t1
MDFRGPWRTKSLTGYQRTKDPATICLVDEASGASKYKSRVVIYGNQMVAGKAEQNLESKEGALWVPSSRKKGSTAAVSAYLRQFIKEGRAT